MQTGIEPIDRDGVVDWDRIQQRDDGFGEDRCFWRDESHCNIQIVPPKF